MTDVFIAPGLRTPFVKAGGLYAKHSALALSSPVVQAMAAKARPDLLVWSQVIPDPATSNIARELVFEAGLDPSIPAFSTVLACASSFVAAITAAGMIGHGDAHLALIGGVETMSHVSDASRGWTNKQTGRSQGEHTEDTIRHFAISREAQDCFALKSHQGAIDGMDSGFFDDLVLSFDGVDYDTIPRRDTSLEKLAKLTPAFAADGTLTAGNSSPVTDGAASLWVGDREGIERLGAEPAVELVDWELAAMDFRNEPEGMLMAPARAIPRLLSRHRLTFKDVASWNIHEAFAAQVLANIRAASDPTYRKEKAGVDFDLGEFLCERVNPHGGSLSLGHPFAATGARILSQAAKEMTAMPRGARGIVSICADGGQGTVALLERR